MKYFVGVDVGTSSVRACLCDEDGKITSKSSIEININNYGDFFYEQSSNNIWESCVKAVRQATSEITDKSDICGIGFDATCSLVVLDDKFNPVSVNLDVNSEENIIMWMDHRAKVESEFISSLKHPSLQYVGGKISLEMQPPKLLWIKKNLSATCWKKAAHFLDLPDFMTMKATGKLSRSLCSAVCKWLCTADETNEKLCYDLNESFWQQIGLGELSDFNFSKMGNELLLPGQPVGDGLTIEAASELGLAPGTAVGASIIDAHAGTIGLLSCKIDGDTNNLTNRLAVICGTSSCHMTLSEEKIFVKGIWGPYFSAVLSGLWLNEGGQSATGKLLDHIIENHKGYKDLVAMSRSNHIHKVLNSILDDMCKKSNVKSPAFLAKDLHVWPDFHGNRSPLADPHLTGMISGLTIDTSVENLALIYLSTIQAIAYGSKLIIEEMKSCGHSLKCVMMCGGLSKNDLFVQIHADVLGLPVYLPQESESVLLGSAILGAMASGRYRSIEDAMSCMGGSTKRIMPATRDESFNHLKYCVFLKMYDHQLEYKNIMSQIDKTQ